MRRPLFLVCIALVLILAFMGNAGDSKEDSPAFCGETLLCREAKQNNSLKLEGCVAACSAVSEGLRLSVSHIVVRRPDNSKLSILPELKITITTDQEHIRPGDYICISGEYEPYSDSRNPGNFDFRAYYFEKDTAGRIKKPKLLSWKRGTADLNCILYEIKRSLRLSCERNLDEKKGRILSAVCLGEKANMEQEWKNVYQEGGISHILAVSGLHITMVGMSVFHLLRRICVPYAGSAVLSGIMAFLYVWMTGFGVSALRALFMFFIWLGAQVAGKKYDMPTAMAVSALMLTAADPACVKSASFLLSFGAVAAISIFLPCVKETCRIRWRIADAAAGSVCIFMGMLPITLYFFYQVSPWSILVNLIVVALMPSLMGMGFLCAFAGLIHENAGIFFGAAPAGLLTLYELLCRIQQMLPMPVWVAGRPSWAAIFLYYLLLVLTGIAARRLERDGVVSEKQKGQRKANGRIRLLWAVIFCICIGLMCPRPQQELRIICLDVGQGDCALLQFPDGTNCLIDGGSSSEKNVWEYRIGETVKYYGVDTLDYIFLSHADSDHISGVREFLQEYRTGIDGRNIHGITVKNLVLPPTLQQEDFADLRMLAGSQGIEVLWMGKKAAVRSDTGYIRWSISCLSPDSGELSGDRNEDSMVLLVQYGSFRMLFTGDLEGEAEEALAGRAENLDADVLKVGHHGSKNGSSEEFLKKVTPKVAVISVGEDNSYGHPAGETLKRLEACGAEILKTEEWGAVTILSDGIGFTIETFRKI